MHHARAASVLLSIVFVGVLACSGKVADMAQPPDGATDAEPDVGAPDATTESGSEGGADGQGLDAQDGTMIDAAMADSEADAPDAGCGPLNTTSNCSSCGIACAMNGSESSAACCAGATCPGPMNGTGNSCQYVCTSGFLDCNAMTPPNTEDASAGSPAQQPALVAPVRPVPSATATDLGRRRRSSTTAYRQA